MERNRSKIAAAAASIVPFHCVICFDEFNLNDRTPMVLPCGHTFVCAQCTKRLKRCMECREPLFLTGFTLAAPSNNPRNSSSAYNPRGMAGGAGRGRYSPSPNCQLSLSPQPASVLLAEQSISNPAPAPIPLPIPRNVVLISLMEAAERQQLDLRRARDEDDLEVELEDEEFNLDRIISGMATFSGPCGTYSVAVEEGLLVQPNDPRATEDKCDGGHDENDDENTIIEDDVVEEPFTLQKGQTVQVVTFEDGVAKLAWGAGYIVASSSQLVKVSGPLETVCRLEGILDTIKARGSDLQSTLDENRQIEASLRSQIDAEMKSEPNHPIISKPPELNFWLQGVKHKDHYTDSTSQPSTPTAAGENAPSFPRTPDNAGTPPLPDSCDSTDGTVNHRQRSPVSIDNADIQRGNIPFYRRAVSEDDLDYLVFGCGAALLGQGPTSLFGAPNILGHFESSTGHHHRDNDDFSNMAPTARMNRSASEQHDQDQHHDYAAPTLTSSFDGVDFRTGLSGHRGLNNAASKAAGNSPTPRYRQMPMMSEHRGIGRVRAPPTRRGGNPGNTSHTSTPTFGPRFSPYPFSSGEDTTP